MARLQPPPLAQQVVLITGASSGIGRCTAEYLAERGAKVALVSRRAEALEELARQIAGAGGEALAAPADVTDETQLRAAADAAIERWGRIDTWMNGAAVFVQGGVEETSIEEFRHVTEVNYLGYVAGTKIALEHMRRQGSGHVIQVSSVLGRRGAPYTAPYSAAKSAINGFSDALRAELWGSGIEVSILYPPTIDTPVYHHALGKWGTVPKPPPPVEDPIRVARAIARLAEEPRPSMTFGVFGRLYTSVAKVVPPRIGDWIMQHAAGFMKSDIPHNRTNLYEPMDDEPRVRAGWRQRGLWGITLRDTVRTLPVESAVAAGAVVIGVAGLALKVRGALRSGDESDDR